MLAISRITVLYFKINYSRFHHITRYYHGCFPCVLPSVSSHYLSVLSTVVSGTYVLYILYHQRTCCRCTVLYSVESSTVQYSALSNHVHCTVQYTQLQNCTSTVRIQYSHEESNLFGFQGTSVYLQRRKLFSFFSAVLSHYQV